MKNYSIPNGEGRHDLFAVDFNEILLGPTYTFVMFGTRKLQSSPAEYWPFFWGLQQGISLKGIL